MKIHFMRSCSYDAIREAGYHAAVHGQKTYNGVAILSRGEPEAVERGMGDDVDDPQARLISARIEGVRIISAYVPNPEKWSGSVLCHLEARDSLDRIRDWGLMDVFRQLHPDVLVQREPEYGVGRVSGVRVVG